jgi:metal-sulfur cluster biosynthetic enzyme
VQTIPGVSEVDVELVWDPPWDQSRLTDAARLELGLY